MKKIHHVDLALCGDGTRERLERLLNDGWAIERADASGDRYIIYVLSKD